MQPARLLGGEGPGTPVHHKAQGRRPQMTHRAHGVPVCITPCAGTRAQSGLVAGGR